MIDPFFLNFDETEGVFHEGGVNPKPVGQQTAEFGPVRDDGDDRIFGDLGNDWLVGGTGRDNMYGGWGNDLLNADDDHTTNGGLNDGPDTHPTYEDRAYGGAGRDRLIANTGGDRLIDWVGEFNSYLVPFAPFGMGTVSRTLQPQLADYLYALSAADGADPSRDEDTGADPARNGEPEGELGVVRQQDFAWQDQTGAPDDPQAGNIPGGPRDVLRSANFNNSSQASGFFADSGTWDISGGKLQVSAESIHGDAVSVYHVEDVIPGYFEIQASIELGKSIGGWDSNAYLIFDYQSPNDFKFAGLDDKINKAVVGQRDANGWHVIQQSSIQGGVKPDKTYNMLLAVNGLNITLVANNKQIITHTFQPRVIDGWSYGLNYGLVGMGSDNSQGTFDNVALQILPPQITLEKIEDFSGAATLAFNSISGIWSTNGERYDVDPAGDSALSLIDLGVENLNFNSYLELTAEVNTSGRAGFVFDRYEDSFKYVAIDAVADELIVGHYTTKKGWVDDTVISRIINDGQDYTLGVVLKGSTVSVTLDGQALIGHVFNAATVDGDFGLIATGGNASFDDVEVKTDDRAFEGTGETALMAAQSAGESLATSTLTHGELEKIFNAAVTRWTAVGYIDQARLATLDDLEFFIADMAGLTLGRSLGNQIFIDTNAAGYGWFVDETPDANEEFLLSSNGWVAKPNSAADGKMDLLTAVSHEIGHYLGLDHDDSTQGLSVMSDTLQSGTRHMGESSILSSAFFAAGSAFLEEALGLADDSEDEEDVLDETPVMVFNEESGTFLDNESEETSDDEWYIDEGEPESDEDAYALTSIDDEEFTVIPGLGSGEKNGHSGSKINWNNKFKG